MISEGLVLLRIENGIAHLTLNRPDASNGMNVEFLQALCEAIMRCHGEPGVRVVLLRGNGKNFCAGGDVHTFASKGEGMPDYLRVATAWLQNAVTGLIRLEAPVLTCVQGFAAGGGGFGLVCASDLVIAGESAKFLGGATRVGMAPDAGVTVTLSRLIGLRRAAELVFTNPILSATQAREMGIINRVVPDAELEAAALAWAREIATRRAESALAAAKRLLWSGHRHRHRRLPFGGSAHGVRAVRHGGRARRARRRDREAQTRVLGPLMSGERFAGRRALVTGGAKGIGAAIVAAMRREGAHVVFLDRDERASDTLAAETGARGVHLDVTDYAALRSAIADHGPFDTLVNNAGVDQHAFFTQTAPGDWSRLVAVNLGSVFGTTHLTLPAMQNAKFGRIINIASEAGRSGSRGGAVYAAAKGGVIAFTKSIARENARYGITVNVIAPGPIDTPMLQDAVATGGDALHAAMIGATLLRRLGTPAEVAAAVVFLASNEAAFITGETLGVSGGMGVGA